MECFLSICGVLHYSVSGSLLQAVPLLSPFQRLVGYEEGK